MILMDWLSTAEPHLMNVPLTFITAISLALVSWAGVSAACEVAGSELRVGDRLERILCTKDYTAFVYAVGLSAPDGLCFDAEGALVVAEEAAGRITRISKEGTHSPLAEGLRSPEGLCLGENGTLYVTEDIAQGRLLAITVGGELSVVASGLDAPEGVVQVGDSLFVTESTMQLDRDFTTAGSRVSVLRRQGGAWGKPQKLLEMRFPLSFSELAHDANSGIIVATETAGGFIRNALWRLDLRTNESKPFASGLKAPEGLSVTPGESGPFPLFVAEEDVDGKGHGRVSQVDKRGKRSIFATGFFAVEDALVAIDGSIYISEDKTGMIIVLRPAESPE